MSVWTLAHHMVTIGHTPRKVETTTPAMIQDGPELLHGNLHQVTSHLQLKVALVYGTPCICMRMRLCTLLIPIVKGHVSKCVLIGNANFIPYTHCCALDVSCRLLQRSKTPPNMYDTYLNLPPPPCPMHAAPLYCTKRSTPAVVNIV
jgi:hypothetical protein